MFKTDIRCVGFMNAHVRGWVVVLFLYGLLCGLVEWEVRVGEPPISIKIIDTVAEAFVIFSCGIVAKPAVLVVTD